MPVRNYKSELVGVFGYPVAENPTVVMMEAAFKAVGIDWRYLTIEVRPERLAEALRGVTALGMRGINLTMPHKVASLPYLDSVADDAKLIGAVNTVVVEGGRLRGENTDGKGFIASLVESGAAEIEGSSVLLLGAGGAARAIAVELALRGAGSIAIANRTRERGEALARDIASKTSCKAAALAWNGPLALPDDIDILVNATSIGLFPDVGDRPDIDYRGIRPGLAVCDVIPNPPRSAFLAEAERRGAETLDGLGMLVNQGAIGFKLWTGLEAPREAMKTALAKEFGA